LIADEVEHPWAGVPDARIVELPDASLDLFISDEADVIRELRAFVATLRR